VETLVPILNGQLEYGCNFGNSLEGSEEIDAWKNQREFVIPETGYRVRLSEGSRETPSNLLQNGIAAVMPVRVVELAEVVEVEHEERELLLLTTCHA